MIILSVKLNKFSSKSNANLLLICPRMAWTRSVDRLIFSHRSPTTKLFVCISQFLAAERQGNYHQAKLVTSFPQSLSFAALKFSTKYALC